MQNARLGKRTRYPAATHPALHAPTEDPEVHLEALLAELRDNVRLEAGMRITTTIAQAYQRMGLPNPDWLYRAR